jgi:UDP-N-acetylglucosamine 2-epimerase (non-hydrolysing)
MTLVRIACIAGARPNFVKIAAILRQMRQHPRLERYLIHTGQHFSPEMSDSFFDQLQIPRPDVNLEVGGGTHTQQTAEIMKRIEPVFAETAPRLVLVVGDVNSTAASTLVAAKMGIPVAHVEAGLRSFDRTMPEEINRLVTDALSDYLFASERSGVENLRREGVSDKRIFLSGNVMIDTLLQFRQAASGSPILTHLGLSARSYVVATLHRPANVDQPESLRGLIESLQTLAARIPVVFPIHPRTRTRIEEAGISLAGLVLSPALPYLDFLRLVMDARLVLTDSGGIQEETTILQVPCLTMRENTERPATITHGTNRLVGTNPQAVLQAAIEALDAPMPSGKVPELWDGRASERILDVLEHAL